MHVCMQTNACSGDDESDSSSGTGEDESEDDSEDDDALGVQVLRTRLENITAETKRLQHEAKCLEWEQVCIQRHCVE